MPWQGPIKIARMPPTLWRRTKKGGRDAAHCQFAGFDRGRGGHWHPRGTPPCRRGRRPEGPLPRPQPAAYAGCWLATHGHLAAGGGPSTGRRRRNATCPVRRDAAVGQSHSPTARTTPHPRVSAVVTVGRAGSLRGPALSWWATAGRPGQWGRRPWPAEVFQVGPRPATHVKQVQLLRVTGPNFSTTPAGADTFDRGGRGRVPEVDRLAGRAARPLRKVPVRPPDIFQQLAPCRARPAWTRTASWSCSCLPARARPGPMRRRPSCAGLSVRSPAQSACGASGRGGPARKTTAAPAGARQGGAGPSGALTAERCAGRRHWRFAMRPAAQARQAIDLRRLGDLGRRLGPGGGDQNQEQLVAAADSAPAGVRQRARPGPRRPRPGRSERAARAPAHGPGHEEEEPQHEGQAAVHGDRRPRPWGAASCGAVGLRLPNSSVSRRAGAADVAAAPAGGRAAAGGGWSWVASRPA